MVCGAVSHALTCAGECCADSKETDWGYRSWGPHLTEMMLQSQSTATENAISMMLGKMYCRFDIQLEDMPAIDDYKSIGRLIEIANDVDVAPVMDFIKARFSNVDAKKATAAAAAVTKASTVPEVRQHVLRVAGEMEQRHAQHAVFAAGGASEPVPAAGVDVFGFAPLLATPQASAPTAEPFMARPTEGRKRGNNGWATLKAKLKSFGYWNDDSNGAPLPPNNTNSGSPLGSVTNV